jgi:hypothetical protein
MLAGPEEPSDLVLPEVCRSAALPQA